MDRIKKRNTAIITIVCFSIAIAFTLGTTVFAAQGYPISGYKLYTNDGKAFKEASGYIYLSTPANSSDSWAKIKCFYNEDFDAIYQFSFDYYRITGTVTPYMILELDTDLNGWPDLWLVQWPEKVSETPEADIEWHTFSKDCWQYSPGGEGGSWTLSELQSLHSGKVRGIKVAIGNWESLYAHEYFINNITVNDIVIVAQESSIPTPTPMSTPTSTPIPSSKPAQLLGGGYHIGGAFVPRDTDGDGYSDVDEMLAGTDWKDATDYQGKPTPTPFQFGLASPEVTTTPTPMPIPTLTPEPISESIPEEGLSWKWIGATLIAAAICVLLYLYRRYRSH